MAVKGKGFEREVARVFPSFGRRIMRCFDEKTLILTEDGFKNIDEVCLTDRLATRTQEGKLEYHAPNQIYKYENVDKLIKISSGAREFLFTEDHELLLKRRHCKEDFHKVKVKDFVNFPNKYNYKTCCTTTWIGVDDTSFFEHKNYKEMLPFQKSIVRNIVKSSQLKSGILAAKYGVDRHAIAVWRKKPLEPSYSKEGILKKLLFLSGYYLSEGSVSQNKRAFTLHEPKSKYQKILLHCLKCLGFTGNTVPDERRDDYSFLTFSGFAWYKLFPYDGCYHKQIPQELKQLSPRYLKYLFLGLVLGDGHKKNGVWHSYCTVSKKLAEDVMEIALKLGYRVSLGIEEKDNPNWRDTYRVYFSSRKKDVRYGDNTTTEEIEYSGRVWGVTVQNATVLIMRNGDTCWTGNSGAIGTLEGITQLMGDVVWKLPWFSMKILIEAKHGYGTAKSMTLKKEWFDKIDMEAGKAGAFPAFAFRFNDAKQARYIAFHLDVWKKLMDEVQAMFVELEMLRNKEYAKKDNE